MPYDERCPYCFSKLSEATYTNDPILQPNGTTKWFNPNSGQFETVETPFHKGFTIICNKHITELQELYDDYKPTGGWTPCQDDASGIWVPNKQHIKELRDAIESALGITGPDDTNRTSILEQYFNYDEEGIERKTPHQTDWTDPTLTDAIWQGSISHMHIEDLRHYLSPLPAERFTITPPATYINLAYSHTFAGATPSNATNTLSTSQVLTTIDTSRFSSVTLTGSLYYNCSYTPGIAGFFKLSWADTILLPIEGSLTLSTFVQANSNRLLQGNTSIVAAVSVSTLPPQPLGYAYSEGLSNGISIHLDCSTSLQYQYSFKNATITPQITPKLLFDTVVTGVFTAAELIDINNFTSNEGTFSIYWYGSGVDWTNLPWTSISNLNLYNEFIARNGRIPTTNDRISSIRITHSSQVKRYISDFQWNVLPLPVASSHIATGTSTLDNIIFHR